MVKVAVAGGNGDVGRTIVEVLRANPEHSIHVLSRESNGDGAIVVDYADPKSLQETLETYSVELVISCLALTNESTSKAEINLIRAANSSSTTSRFISSLWAVPSPAGSAFPDFSSASIAELENTSLEYTTVINGHFSDYYGYPLIKTHLKHADFLIDIANKTAVIPGSGDDKVVFTYSFDVARFVDALISSSEPWSKQSTIIGDVVTINELVQLAEKARGHKFNIHRDDDEKLRAFQPTELPSHKDAYKLFPKPQLQMMFAVLSQWITQGAFDLSSEGSLNQKFPEIKTKSVQDVIGAAW